MQKVLNKGGIDPYTKKQAQMTSSALPMGNDYTGNWQLNKERRAEKAFNVDTFQNNSSPKREKKSEQVIQQPVNNWLAGGKPGGETIRNRPDKYNPQNTKQGQLLSQMDTHGYIPPGAKTENKYEKQYNKEKRDFWAPAGSSPKSRKL